MIPLLEIRGLTVDAVRRGERRRLVHGIDLDIAQGEVLGVVGESGSGKSLTIRSCLRMLPRGLEAGGRIGFAERDVLTLPRRALTDLRARDIAMIHQDPRSAINPTRTIRQFLLEGVVQTRQMSPEAAYEAACGLMRDVGIPDPERRMMQYPFQLSGGLLQRMMIVSALLPGPRLILADEPTTALDVTVQSDVMAILLEQIQQRDVGMLLVTHDLDLAAAVSDRLAVMHDGRLVETGPASAVSEHPRHPYTRRLLQARPSVDGTRRTLAPPEPLEDPDDACAVDGACDGEAPMLHAIGDHRVACHREGGAQ